MRTLHTTPARASRDNCSMRQRGRAATTTRKIAVDLTPQAVEQIAQRITQLLGQAGQRPPEFVSAGELARHLRVQRPWIYRHRHLLGGQRIGDGPKAPWRFDLDTATQALERHQAGRLTDGRL